MQKIKYYIFCIKWLWKNRTWDNTRQKFKTMEKEYKQKYKVQLERKNRKCR